jgi:hypothetical protein
VLEKERKLRDGRKGVLGNYCCLGVNKIPFKIIHPVVWVSKAAFVVQVCVVNYEVRTPVRSCFVDAEGSRPSGVTIAKEDHLDNDKRGRGRLNWMHAKKYSRTKVQKSYALQCHTLRLSGMRVGTRPAAK